MYKKVTLTHYIALDCDDDEIQSAYTSNDVNMIMIFFIYFFNIMINMMKLNNPFITITYRQLIHIVESCKSS